MIIFNPSHAEYHPTRAGRKMANRTQKDAKSIKGTNPQYLVEKIIRTRIYDSKYWKEQCFGLSCKPILHSELYVVYRYPRRVAHACFSYG